MFISRRRLSVGTVFVSVSLFLGGCSAGSDSVNSQDAFDPESLGPSSLFAGTYALPLDAVLSPPTAEVNAIENAVWESVAPCMAEKGFEFSQRSEYTQTGSKNYYFGVTSTDEAAVYGYRRPAEGNVTEPVDDTPEETGSLGLGTGDEAASEYEKQFRRALMGDEADWVQIKDEDTGAVIANYDPNACWGKSMDELQPNWGKRYALEAIARQIATDASLAAYESNKVIEGFAAWSACMAKQGFEFKDPDAAYFSVWPGDNPGLDEVKTAVADAQCKADTGLGKTWSAEVARLELAALEKHPGLVERWQEINKSDLATVRGSK